MKPLLWVPLLPLAGLALFYLLAPPIAQKGASEAQIEALEKPRAVAPPRSLLGQSPKPKSDQSRIIEAKLAELKKQTARSKELRAQVADSMTPEKQQQTVDLLLRHREPQYLRLFATWDVGPATREDTIRIIRERDSKLMALRLEFHREGPSYAREFTRKRKIVEGMAEEHLIELLGEKRFTELTLMENNMLSTSQ